MLTPPGPGYPAGPLVTWLCCGPCIIMLWTVHHHSSGHEPALEADVTCVTLRSSPRRASSGQMSLRRGRPTYIRMHRACCDHIEPPTRRLQSCKSRGVGTRHPAVPEWASACVRQTQCIQLAWHCSALLAAIYDALIQRLRQYGRSEVSVHGVPTPCSPHKADPATQAPGWHWL